MNPFYEVTVTGSAQVATAEGAAAIQTAPTSGFPERRITEAFALADASEVHLTPDEKAALLADAIKCIDTDCDALFGDGNPAPETAEAVI